MSALNLTILALSAMAASTNAIELKTIGDKNIWLQPQYWNKSKTCMWVKDEDFGVFVVPNYVATTDAGVKQKEVCLDGRGLICLTQDWDTENCTCK